jgi:hypothetical protein
VNPLVDQVARVRQKCNPNMTFYAVDLHGTGSAILEPSPEGIEEIDSAGGHNVLISGFSSNIVQYIGAKTSTQLSLIQSLQPREAKKTELE